MHKNAELRGEVNKLKRDNGELQQLSRQSEEKVLVLERQRKKDCDYLLKQEGELEKLRESRK